MTTPTDSGFRFATFMTRTIASVVDTPATRALPGPAAGVEGERLDQLVWARLATPSYVDPDQFGTRGNFARSLELLARDVEQAFESLDVVLLFPVVAVGGVVLPTVDENHDPDLFVLAIGALDGLDRALELGRVPRFALIVELDVGHGVVVAHLEVFRPVETGLDAARKCGHQRQQDGQTDPDSPALNGH
jgi:hypothetical protein